MLGFKIDWDGKGLYAEFKHQGWAFPYTSGRSCPGCWGVIPLSLRPERTFELAVNLPTPADVEREFTRVVRAGGTPVYAPRLEPWGMFSSIIADPEGNLIEIGSWNHDAKYENEQPGG